ncbi:MAG: apolipoprotein N-acyltransferase [Planctomycetes bacterium]|nr:apolipoprotein N-acyltransferase [Planctomycetota bacterium]
MTKLRWGLPFLFALMFWSSFHPLNFGILGHLCLVPLLVYAQVTSGKKSFFVAWAGGYVAFAAGYSWFAYTVPIGPWLVAIYMGLWIPIFVSAVRRVGILGSPLIWLGTEVLRSTLFGGLPWLLLGYTQHDLLYFIQIADLGGIWLVSLLVAFVNAALVHPGRRVKIAAAAALLASVAYGAIRVETLTMTDGPTIAVVQPNIPQDLKLNALNRKDVAEENYRKHVELTRKAAEGRPDLIVWPEAAIYRGVYMSMDDPPEWLRSPWYFRLTEPAKMTGFDTVIGALVVEERSGKRDTYTNSAVWVKPDGKIAGRYDKIHLVPFAESFSIFREIVRKVSGLPLEEMRAGEAVQIWETGGTKYGTQICYEAIFPEISREIARKGGAFTVNISNDGWFKASGELDQMLAMARFRSIENRMHVVRATNTGISAFIEPTGRLQAMLAVDGKLKEVEGVLAGRIRVTAATSLYRAAGDWAAWLGLGAAAGLLARRIFVDRKKKSA